jgi:hypothetical protein
LRMRMRRELKLKWSIFREEYMKKWEKANKKSHFQKSEIKITNGGRKATQCSNLCRELW